MKYTRIPEPEGYQQALAAAIAKLTGCSRSIQPPVITLAEEKTKNHPDGWWRKFEKRNKRK